MTRQSIKKSVRFEVFKRDPIDELTDLAKTVHSWAQFEAYIDERLGR